MALQFVCDSCGGEVIVRFLKRGEKAQCKHCGATNVVPEGAVTTDAEPDYTVSDAVPMCTSCGSLNARGAQSCAFCGTPLPSHRRAGQEAATGDSEEASMHGGDPEGNANVGALAPEGTSISCPTCGLRYSADTLITTCSCGHDLRKLRTKASLANRANADNRSVKKAQPAHAASSVVGFAVFSAAYIYLKPQLGLGGAMVAAFFASFLLSGIGALVRARPSSQR